MSANPEPWNPWPLPPMLAAPAPGLMEPGVLPGGCVYEPKYDGFRALVFVEDDRVRIQSRGGHDITACFPEIAAEVSSQIPPGVVLDGELVVWGQGRLDFPALQTRLASKRNAAVLARERPASYMVFDVLAVEHQSTRRLALSDRRVLLEAVLAQARPPLHLVPTTTDVEMAREWVAGYAAALGVGVEGLVIKGAAEPYRPGKRGWFKYRLRETHEMVVGAATGSLGSPGRLVLGYYTDSGRLRVAGATTALSDRQRVQVGALLVEATGEHPWPAEIPSGWLGVWAEKKQVIVVRAEPLLVVEVSADSAFEHGRWRHLVRFVRAREERDPVEIRPPFH